MSAAEKIHELPLTPRDLAYQLLNEAASGPDLNWEARFAKLMQTRHRALLDAALIELAQLYADGKKPKPSKPEPTGLEQVIEKAKKKAERDARRAFLAGQVDVAAEKRVIARLAANATQHDLWKIGHKFGKKNGRKVIWTLFSEKELAADGIVKV